MSAVLDIVAVLAKDIHCLLVEFPDGLDHAEIVAKLKEHGTRCGPTPISKAIEQLAERGEITQTDGGRWRVSDKERSRRIARQRMMTRRVDDRPSRRQDPTYERLICIHNFLVDRGGYIATCSAKELRKDIHDCIVSQLGACPKGSIGRAIECLQRLGVVKGGAI